MLVKETSQDHYAYTDAMEKNEFEEFNETILRMIDELDVKEEEIHKLLEIKLPAS